VFDPQPARLSKLRTRLSEEGVRGLLVTHLPNVRYLTGFTGSNGVVVVLPELVALVTDFRYAAQAPQEVGNDVRVEIPSADLWERVAKIVGRGQGEGLGLEAEAMTVATAQRLTDVGLPGVRPTRGLVEGLRASKEPDEVEAIRKAAALAADALEDALPAIRVGTSEREVASVLEAELRRRGSEWHPFPTIVASGPRSALPHARTSARVIGQNEILLLDFGAQLDGYCADLTRTVVVGHADERQRVMYDLVRDAQSAALAGLRAGLTGKEGDALARRVIEARGFGDAFGHSLGHGLGLEVHEAPRLGRTNEQPLPDGAVVTVEPGVYFPGWGGVRIEDDVWLGPDGATLLSDGKTELVELGQ
jgi:Xaa-Pro aminopeptidase